MKLYLMRHGSTVMNEKQITQGRMQNVLSKTGKEQTQKVAEDFKNVKIDVIYCSPIKRAVQTANIVNKLQNVKFIKNEDLTEIDQGIFTGRARNSLTEEEKHLKEICASCCKAETYDSVFARAKHFVEFLKNQKYQNVLVVTHNIVASYIELILQGKDLPEDKRVCTFDHSQIKSFDI